MAWLRTLSGILALVALVVATCVPASMTASAASPAREVVAVTAAAEPCAGTHGITRCDLKALPASVAPPSGPVPATAELSVPASQAERGVWPEVEPDPPRA